MCSHICESLSLLTVVGKVHSGMGVCVTLTRAAFSSNMFRGGCAIQQDHDDHIPSAPRPTCGTHTSQWWVGGWVGQRPSQIGAQCASQRRCPLPRTTSSSWALAVCCPQEASVPTGPPGKRNSSSHKCMAKSLGSRPPEECLGSPILSPSACNEPQKVLNEDHAGGPRKFETWRKHTGNYDGPSSCRALTTSHATPHQKSYLARCVSCARNWRQHCSP